ncbi:hypothetical protein LI322_28270, partial [Bacteroides cellulosilyticus]
SAQSDSEVECKKCRSTLEIVVKDDIVSVHPLIIRDEQLKSKQILKDIGVGFAESDSESDLVSDDEPTTQNVPRMA